MGQLVPLVEGRESLTSRSKKGEEHFPGWALVTRALPWLNFGCGRFHLANAPWWVYVEEGILRPMKKKETSWTGHLLWWNFPCPGTQMSLGGSWEAQAGVEGEYFLGWAIC